MTALRKTACLLPFLFSSLLLIAPAAQPLAAQPPAAPIIDKIDPPDWFASLPDPMLLIHGDGLHGASFSIAGNNVHVIKTQSSPNGHWAMLWLNTHAAAAGTLKITAHTASGNTAFDYKLSPRRPAADGMAGFSSADVMTCIMPDRFADGDPSNNVPAASPNSYDRTKPHSYHGGDLRGVIDHLDYLHELGVTAVWLTPVLENYPGASDYHGYGATDMYAVDPHLGTLADYRELGIQLHKRGMKLIFDDVPNHVGQHIVWAQDPPLPDWFHGTPANHLPGPQEQFGALMDPHAPQAGRTGTVDGWFVNTLPDMNQQNPVVAQYLTENMIWWIEKAGIDGLRIDTFPYVQRTFWQQYLPALTRLYPHLTEVGEVSGRDVPINAFFAGERTVAGVDTHLTTPFDYPMYYTLRDVLLHHKPMSQLELTLRQDWLYPHPEALVTFLGNHDQPRFLNESGATPALLRIGFGLIMTMRGTPQLYIGDEINMTGGEDPDNRRDFPGGFPNDPRNAFTPTGRTAAERETHDWQAQLGKLRAESPALQTGAMQTVLADDTGFAFIRTLTRGASACSGPGGSMLIVVNRQDSPRDFTIPVAETALEGCHSATTRLGEPAQHNIDRQLTLTLGPNALTVLQLR